MGRLRILALVLAAGLGVTAGGCSPEPEAGRAGGDESVEGSPTASRDRLGGSESVDPVHFDGTPAGLVGPVDRIVSLVPSATETLVLLGALERLVGRTDYDTAPALSDLPSVGGGLQPNLEILRTLDPDAVVAFAGESDVRTEQVLTGLGIPVVQVRPSRIEDIRIMVDQMGRLVGARARAEELIAEIDGALAAVGDAVAGIPPVRFAYLLGGTPPLAAGSETFLSQLAEAAGGVNVLDDLGALYAPVSPEVLRERDIEVVLMTRGSRVDPRVLEGRRAVELPSWVEIPGPTLGRSAWEVAGALHPDLLDARR